MAEMLPEFWAIAKAEEGEEKKHLAFEGPSKSRTSTPGLSILQSISASWAARTPADSRI